MDSEREHERERGRKKERGTGKRGVRAGDRERK